MINNLSRRLTDKLLSNGTISEDEQELYIYGFFMLLSHLMYLIFVCVIGLMLGCIFESIIFYISFQFIRRYAGGYHASTETRCQIMSSFSLAACIVVIRLSKIYDFKTVVFAVSIAAAVCIFLLSPLDTAQKPLSEKEFNYFRKISWLILFIITAAIIISYALKIKFLLIPCCMSLILEGILLVSGKIKREYTRKKSA